MPKGARLLLYTKMKERIEEIRKAAKEKLEEIQNLQELQDLKVQVISLKEKGLSIRKIAKELNVTASKIQRVLKD